MRAWMQAAAFLKIDNRVADRESAKSERWRIGLASDFSLGCHLSKMFWKSELERECWRSTLRDDQE